MSTPAGRRQALEQVTSRGVSARAACRLAIVTGILIVSLPLLIFGCTKKYANFREDLKEGQSKESIVQLLGDTYGRGTIVKSNTPMFGPQEGFWDQIPEGTRMEVWTYQFSDGNLYLYFMDGAEKVTFIAFAPQGIVY